MEVLGGWGVPGTEGLTLPRGGKHGLKTRHRSKKTPRYHSPFLHQGGDDPAPSLASVPPTPPPLEVPKMTPSDRSSSALVSGPATARSVPEFEGRRRAEETDNASLTEIYKAGNLTVFAGDRTHPDRPVQLDFHYKTGNRRTAHWHGLLRGDSLFLDTPHLVLEVNGRESLIATLEYIDEKTETDMVFVNFHKSRRDRGDLLRAFSYLGFELVRPDHPALPAWGDVVFMVYPMEREPCPTQELERAKPGAFDGQDGAMPTGDLLTFE